MHTARRWFLAALVCERISAVPSAHPSSVPTTEPSAIPEGFPSATPTTLPSKTPTNFPSVTPTRFPSATPTSPPSAEPTSPPSATPTSPPSATPTNPPSSYPTDVPASAPTIVPTSYPTVYQAVRLSKKRAYAEEGKTASYTLELTTEPTAYVLVNIEIASNSALATVTTTLPLNFTTTTWSIKQTVMVEAVQNSEDSGYACADVSSTPEPCSPASYSLGSAVNCSACPAGYMCSSTSSEPQACESGSRIRVRFDTRQASRVCSGDSNLAWINRMCDMREWPIREWPRLPALHPMSARLQLPQRFRVASSVQQWDVLWSRGCYVLIVPIRYNKWRCGRGMYAVPSRTECQECSAGYACPSPEEDPTACDSGYYSLDGSTQCTPCPAGYSCSDTDRSPIPCARGSYALVAQTECTDCPAGYKCTSSMEEPSTCPGGTYSLGNSTDCYVCPAAHFCETTDAGPVACPYVGRELAIPCPSGSYSTGAQSLCTACAPGWYCPYTGRATRYPCNLGTFSDAGQASCTECPAGLCAAFLSSRSLLPEASHAGFKCPTTSSSSLIACRVGSYSRLGDPYCHACPAGTSFHRAHCRLHSPILL
ncbi:hypothetical protein CTAYLR_002284 [Chrysophaeum taylorii]|uniref:Tyrosine-protein kinase ephrin type A/B receptor-like domain-containing protein n=1 Tax=Chrysophaeum taylorii TaxID=2483200 RepID=A0AAD7UPQ7_9STRA|nr:hypothetical protein CTAYLR_002284 [Chrysophaeum taylorii]